MVNLLRNNAKAPRIIDLSRTAPGRIATSMLLSFGCEVLALEEPGFAKRRGNPDVVRLPEGAGKRSLLLDLKHPSGREIFLELCETADVVLEGFRPGVMDRLGLGAEVVRRRNPTLVYCSASGFGPTGPYRDLPGHDLQFQSVTGILQPNSSVPPGMPPVLWADKIAVMQIALGVLGSLLSRAVSGKGAHLQISYLDGILPAAADLEPMLQGSYPCYRLYECGDKRWFAVAIREPWFWTTLCERVEKPEWASHMQPTADLAGEMHAFFERMFRTRTRADWENQFLRWNLPGSPVLTPSEARNSLQVTARSQGGTVSHTSPIWTAIPQGGIGVTTDAPLLGQHTYELLIELGRDESEITALVTDAVVATPKQD